MSVASTDWLTYPVFSIDYLLVYKSPEFKVLQTFFLDVFTPQFWFASLGITFLIVLVGWIFNKSRPLNEENSSLILLSAFVLTSAVDLPSTKRSTFRFFLLVAGLFSFMFVSAFNLFLTSFLSTQTTILPFKTLDDIAEVGSHSFCINELAVRFMALIGTKWEKIINAPDCPPQYVSGNPFQYACENQVVMAFSEFHRK